MIRVFIGYDKNEPVSYHVLSHSIQELASVPVSITAVKLPQLRSVFDRPRDPKQSTDFSFSRFLVPWMSGYEGFSLFLDCDFLACGDLAELWQLRSENTAVQVVKHDYSPSGRVKFLGHQQSAYPKKNWSSAMLFNNSRCRALTPEYVSRASGLELHQFKWLASEEEIGDLPPEWNHLVSEYEANPKAKLVHFTVGGPWWDEFRDCEFSDHWRAARERMLYAKVSEADPVA